MVLRLRPNEYYYFWARHEFHNVQDYIVTAITFDESQDKSRALGTTIRIHLSFNLRISQSFQKNPKILYAFSQKYMKYYNKLDIEQEAELTIWI